MATIARADDGCEGAAIIETSALPMVLDLDTTGEPNHATSLCSPPVLAPDLVHAISLVENMTLDVAVEPAPDYDVILYVRALHCDDPLAELLCADVAPAGGREALRLHLPPGNHYIYVDGHSPLDYGPVTLFISGILPLEGHSWGEIKILYANESGRP